MAAAVSEWTTIGVNSGNPSAQGLNVDIVAGTSGQVRHECLLWMDGTDKIVTNHMDWNIDGDFTVTLNGTVNDITADAGNVDVDVEGSLDGTNYVKLADLVTWDAGGGAATEAVGHAVYDYDTNGRMPYMRLAFTADDANCTAAANNTKVTVMMHNG
tara:strand:+ start:64 stop:534 length:471 start_codon:yes stop_codon:yes gene_type:complete